MPRLATAVTAAGLVAASSAAAQAPPPRCEPQPGRRADQIAGQVTRGERLERRTPGGWILRLVPVDEGWYIEVSTAGREAENLSRLTPPWHFVPNPRYLEGWHFRNQANTGPNDGSVNAPQEFREFIFSPEVGRTIEYQGSATPAADVERVAAFGRGWLLVEEYRLTPPRRGERAGFEWLRFSACLTWPADSGGAPPPGLTSPPDPSRPTGP